MIIRNKSKSCRFSISMTMELVILEEVTTKWISIVTTWIMMILMKSQTSLIFFSLLWKSKWKKMKMITLKEDFLQCKSAKIEMIKIIRKKNQQLIFQYKKIIIKNYRVHWLKIKFYKKSCWNKHLWWRFSYCLKSKWWTISFKR